MMDSAARQIAEGQHCLSFCERRTDEVFAHIDQCHLPGVAIGVAINGRPVYRKGFGLASIEIPFALTSGTRMRLYSVTKHFTCLAFLLLCEEGRADEDAPISEYLSELSSVSGSVTARQLMGNQSGLRDVHDLNWVFSGVGREVASDDLLAYYKRTDDRNADPDTAWGYNNGGFLLLTAIIERLTGSTIEQYLQERIFRPAGMQDTLIRRFDSDFVPRSATMHMSDGSGGFDRSYLGSAMAGEGGLVSTVDDMLRWLAHMDSPAVGSAATWAMMRTPQRLENGLVTGYGFGLMIDHYRGLPIVYHSGGGMGANAHMLKAPTIGLDIVIMSNRYDVQSAALAYQVIDRCVEGLHEESRSAITPVSGVFRSPRTGRVVELHEDQGKQKAWIDNYDIEYRSDDSGTLWPAQDFAFLKQSIRIVRHGARIEGLVFSDFGNDDRLDPVERKVDDARNLAIGTFETASGEVRVRIEAGEDGYALRSKGAFGETTLPLYYVRTGIWRAKGRLQWMGGVLVFNEKHDTMTFTSARTAALAFRRTAE